MNEDIYNLFIDVDWKGNTEDLLQKLSEIFNKALEGSEYYCKRNSTVGEKDIDIFKKGRDSRIGFIWPKKRLQAVDFSLERGFINSLKLKMELPAEEEVKPGRYSGWRNFDKISPEKAYEILENLTKI